MVTLLPHQRDAIQHLGSGKILWGGVGTGKSHTVLAYYMEKEAPKDIYVITTAKKRDTLEWQRDASDFAIGISSDATVAGVLTIDSWNNIHKYIGVSDAFFVFDEQRLVGTGAWTKSFQKIVKQNNWVMLTATPGDNWLDYMPVFIANGWYKNATAFKEEHVVYKPFSRYPKVDRYLGIQKLQFYRNEILVEMPYDKHTNRTVEDIETSYDMELFNKAWKERWHVYEDRPLKDVAELYRVMRRIVNSDLDRLAKLRMLMGQHPRLIVFYNFDYELEILRSLSNEIPLAEWNGHRKQEIPDSPRWIYLVQYVAGAEGWNCVSTDTVVFYSLTYSYKNFEQAQGRIDRLDTLYTDLHYYVLASNSVIDRGIRNSLKHKKNFQQRHHVKKLYQNGF